MASTEIVDEKTLRVIVDIADAIEMIHEAARDLPHYASDIQTIYEKMPAFDYTSFCFYAYDSAKLFEFVIGMDPRQYNSFSLSAPDGFFYTLYGGMAALYESAQALLEQKTETA